MLQHLVFPPFQDAYAFIEIYITEEDDANEAETVESVEQEQRKMSLYSLRPLVQGVIYNIFVTKTLQ